MTRGSYSVALPDGRVQTVSYTGNDVFLLGIANHDLETATEHLYTFRNSKPFITGKISIQPQATELILIKSHRRW